MSKWDNMPKRFVFESNEKTLFETNSIFEMRDYISHNVGELIQTDIMVTDNYIHFIYLGYTLLIYKKYPNEFGM